MKCNEPMMVNNQQACPPQLAEIHIERQPYVALYSPCDALRNGTVFPNLNFPYVKTCK